MADHFDLTDIAGRAAFLQATFDIETFTDACRIAHEKSPDDAPVAFQYSSGLRAIGETEHQMRLCRDLVKAFPNNPAAHYSLALALLEAGQYREAWPHYTARVALRKKPQKAQFLPQEKRWIGKPIGKEPLVLVHEQGLGDTLQFLRYALQMRNQGASVLIDPQPALKDLLGQNQAFRDILFTQPDEDIGHWCVLTDLLPLSCPTYDQVTCPGAYINPPAVADPFVLPAGASGKIRVGLAWSGNAAFSSNWLRSIPLEALAPLRTVESCQFYSLLPPSFSQDLAEAGHDDWIVDLAQVTSPFAALARAVAAMDVVVTVCTSVAHLAGAMGKPVIILLSSTPDWRWGNDPSETTRWYTSARLFRQSRFGDWSGPVTKARAHLASL